MAIRVVTDSTSDLPPDLAAEHGITVLPAYINIGEESYLDGVELSRQEFYEQLPHYKTPPTTAAPAVGTFTQAYDELAAAGATQILSIHLASSLSGIVNAARLGAQSAEGVEVTVFDSQQLTMGLGLLALNAARAAAAGATMDELVGRLEAERERTYVFAMLDTLEFLRRSGRVSWTAFGLGTLLRIKLIVRVHRGQVASLDKVRTHGRALQRLLQHVADLGPLQEIALLHTSNPDGIGALRERAQPLFPPGRRPLAAEVTPTIGAHVGPGALGFACIAAGEPAS